MKGMYVILVYDIKETDTKTGARILRNVFKITKKYMTHIQNSVFEGELSGAQLTQLKFELQKHLRSEKDSCIVFHGHNKKWMTKEFFTKKIEENEQFL